MYPVDQGIEISNRLTINWQEIHISGLKKRKSPSDWVEKPFLIGIIFILFVGVPLNSNLEGTVSRDFLT